MGLKVVEQCGPATTQALPAIKGFIETSLIDWDGYISAIMFLGRCNFECPFCHDYELLTGKGPTIPFESIEEMLLGQKGWVDGVVVTGGEPTSDRAIVGLLERLKSLELQVKLDTNGSNPAVLRDLVGTGLVDYIALVVQVVVVEQFADIEVNFGQVVGVSSIPANNLIVLSFVAGPVGLKHIHSGFECLVFQV